MEPCLSVIGSLANRPLSVLGTAGLCHESVAPPPTVSRRRTMPLGLTLITRVVERAAAVSLPPSLRGIPQHRSWTPRDASSGVGRFRGLAPTKGRLRRVRKPPSEWSPPSGEPDTLSGGFSGFTPSHPGTAPASAPTLRRVWWARYDGRDPKPLQPAHPSREHEEDGHGS